MSLFRGLGERLRDMEERQNTLLPLDELVNLGVNVLVLGENVKVSQFGGGYGSGEPKPAWLERISAKNCVAIDRKWVAGQTLGEGGDDTRFEDDYPAASDKRGDLEDNVAIRTIEYALFRPSVLTDLLKRTDLVVAPPELIPKLKEEVPEANVALLVDDESHYSLTEPAGNPNHVRVLIRSRKEDEKRVDWETIELLFKPRKESTYSDYDWRSSDSLMATAEEQELSNMQLDRSFYEFLQKSYANPITRRTISPKDEVVFRIGNAILNFYSYGGHRRRSRVRGNRLLAELRGEKKERITKIYESLWLVPLQSIEEVLDRQKTLSEMVEDESQLEKVTGLAQSVNALIEPHLHLRGMSKHISTNILGSRWGAAISRADFYSDFLRAAEEFVRAYETAIGNIDVRTESREMGVLLASLQELLARDVEGSIHGTYEFLRNVLSSEPKDFNELRKLFKAELVRTGARKIKELEEYKEPPKFSEDEQVPKGAKADMPWEKESRLEELLSRFHSQAPVAKSERAINSVDYIGSKLAAYVALARFIKENGWVKPEILPAEDGIVDIQEGFYPLTPSNRIVPNDTYLDANEAVEILEGTNAGGKTIDAKKTMFIVAAALTGNYVPARKARISAFNRVRFRIKDTGMYDTGALAADLKKMEEAIRALGTPIMIGLDETFTSTNAREGEALTFALIKRLIENGNARAVITSHYPTLQDMEGSRGVKFSHFGFERCDGAISFPYRKKPGVNLRGDYALAIAENEGVPPSIMSYAKAYHKRFGGAK